MEVQEMKDMIAAMKIEFEEAIDEKRQDFEATREELKVWVALKLIVFLLQLQITESHSC